MSYKFPLVINNNGYASNEGTGNELELALPLYWSYMYDNYNLNMKTHKKRIRNL